MAVNDAALRDRFRGCLLGLAVGDALGGRFEAQTAEALRARFPTVRDLFDSPRDEIWYADEAAMRVAPVGLLFRDDLTALWEQARLSALPTHRHPLGIEGAQLLALAVALCCRAERLDRGAFLAELLAA